MAIEHFTDFLSEQSEVGSAGYPILGGATYRSESREDKCSIYGVFENGVEEELTCIVDIHDGRLRVTDKIAEAKHTGLSVGGAVKVVHELLCKPAIAPSLR